MKTCVNFKYIYRQRTRNFLIDASKQTGRQVGVAASSVQMPRRNLASSTPAEFSWARDGPSNPQQ